MIKTLFCSHRRNQKVRCYLAALLWMLVSMQVYFCKYDSICENIPYILEIFNIVLYLVMISMLCTYLKFRLWPLSDSFQGGNESLV